MRVPALWLGPVLVLIAAKGLLWCLTPNWCHTFRNTRMPVATIFAGLEEGMSIDELVETYDGPTREQIESVLEFAARSLEAPTPSR